MVRSSRVRRGLSYLEVLISASIALVGLLGAIAIIPLAARNIEKGRVAETMVHVGESAIGRFQTEGWSNVFRWRVSANGSNYAIQGIVDTGDTNYTELKLQADTSPGGTRSHLLRMDEILPQQNPRVFRYYVTNRTAICFDPRMLAEASSTERGTGSEPDVEVFPSVPYNSATEARMLRVSGASFNAGNSAALDALGAANAVRANDDLIIFRTQNDPTLPGKQTFFGPAIMNGTNQATDALTGEPLVTPQFRDHLGEFEWIATLVPKATSENKPTGEYVLSIVVIQNRPRRLSPSLRNGTTAAVTDTFVESERLLNVSQFIGNGYAGGDVRLAPRAGRPVADLTIAEGDWVLLACEGGSGPLFSWYRVMATGDVSGNTIDATLQGSDWPAAELTALGRTTQAVLLNNVVGVFERTIRIETNSQW